MCEYSSQRPLEVIIIDVFITDKFRLPFVPNNIPDIPKEKAFPNGMSPIIVKQIDDIKEVMKYRY
jgi:hypothetical protein